MIRQRQARPRGPRGSQQPYQKASRNVGIQVAQNTNPGARRKPLRQLMLEDSSIANAKILIAKNSIQPINDAEWTKTPSLPTSAELIMGGLAQPLPNLPKAVYNTSQDYLEVQHTLMRYEGIYPLRCAVNEFRDNPYMTETVETCIYDKVYCVSLNIIRLGAFARFKFCNLRSSKLIDWSQTQRLTPGTCVALSTKEDKFRTKCWVGLVTGKQDEDLATKATPIIDIELEMASQLAAFVDPKQELIMIEARSNYFEAVRHVMMGLKLAVQEESSVMKYFTGQCTSVGLPPSIPGPGTRISVSAIIPQRPEATLPAQGPIPLQLPRLTGLDNSQLSALQRMVATDLAIVQGPPGTGKTFTSMAALSVLLANQGKDAPPIIVTAQKNDTVDELLVRLMNNDIRCARLGGQSKNEEIIKNTLLSLRRQYLKGSPAGEQEQRLNTCRFKARQMTEGCFPNKNMLLIEPRNLEIAGIISKEQCASLMSIWEANGSLDYRSKPENHPFAAWLDHKFTLREQPKAIQVPCGNDDKAREISIKEYGPDHDQVHLAEEDMDQKRKDRISNQSILFGSYCQIDVEALGPNEEQVVELLGIYKNLWELPMYSRRAVYRWFEKQLTAKTQIVLQELLHEVDDIARELKVDRWTEDYAAIRASGARVIGCTTTGLTKYRALLAAFQPRIMIVEEAAETREANIAASLIPSVQQLLLVGDHLQLTPHADVMGLARAPYNLAVSAFERFVLRGLGYSTLADQRRMAPEMRAVLNAWYPNLRDHARVLQLPHVPGLGSTRTMWIKHQQPENGNQYLSKFNKFEARLIAGFALYLVLNGVHPSKITVLSFYTGQRMFIHNIMQQISELATIFNHEEGVIVRQGVEVQTVDGYQGKENDVILLSVVRSPGRLSKPSVGFLAKLNRAIVALSRAKLVNVVFGNMQNLLASRTAKEIWAPVNASMKVVTTESIPLTCVQHGKLFSVTAAPQVWGNPVRIGCRSKCKKTLACGHHCTNTCHPDQTAHACSCGPSAPLQGTPLGKVGGGSGYGNPMRQPTSIVNWNLDAHMARLINADMNEDSDYGDDELEESNTLDDIEPGQDNALAPGLLLDLPIVYPVQPKSMRRERLTIPPTDLLLDEWPDDCRVPVLMPKQKPQGSSV